MTTRSNQRANESEAKRQQYQRIAHFRVGDVDDEARTITFTAASDKPLLRNFWGWEFYETLDFRGMDLSWLRSGYAPVLVAHNSRELPSGIIEKARTFKKDETRFLEVTCRFPKEDEDADRVFRKAKAGTLQNVSVGWTPREYDLVEHQDKPDELTFTDFRIDEVSFVSIPADTEVGMGRDVAIANLGRLARRDGGPTPEPKPTPTPDPNANRGGNQPPTPPAPPTPEPAPEVRFDPTGQRWLAKNERKLREQGLGDEAMDKLYNMVDPDKAERGASEQEVKSAVFDLLQERDTNVGNGLPSPGAPGPARINNDHHFSFQRLLVATRYQRELDGIEAEIMKEFSDKYESRRAGTLPPHEAVGFFPHSALLADPATRSLTLRMLPADKRKEILEHERAVYNVGANPAGYHHEVFDENWFVEALVAKAMLLRKVTLLPQELMQDLVGVVETGTATVAHVTETGTRSELGGPSYGNRTMQWHEIYARIDVSRRSLDQSALLFPRLMNVMDRDLYRGINSALINAAGTGGSPTGILHFTGLPTVAIGTNGGMPNYGHLVDLNTRIYAGNADADGMCYVITPEIKGRLQKTPRFTNSQGDAGDMILTASNAGHAGMSRLQIDGYDVMIENNLPKNLTKGTASQRCHAMLFGNFADIEMGMFSGMELIIDGMSKDSIESGQVYSYLRQAYDFLPRHVQSVAAIVDALP